MDFPEKQSSTELLPNRGFAVVEQTDGSRNEEHEPDVRYVWREE